MDYSPKVLGKDMKFQSRLIDTYFANFEDYLEECKSFMVDPVKLARAIHKLKSAIAYLANKEVVDQLSYWENDFETNHTEATELWFNELVTFVNEFNQHLKVYRSKI